jgi:hypothetical protein
MAQAGPSSSRGALVRVAGDPHRGRTRTGPVALSRRGRGSARGRP